MYSLAIQATSEKFIHACMYKIIVKVVVILLTQNKKKYDWTFYGKCQPDFGHPRNEFGTPYSWSTLCLEKEYFKLPHHKTF